MTFVRTFIKTRKVSDHLDLKIPRRRLQSPIVTSRRRRPRSLTHGPLTSIVSKSRTCVSWRQQVRFPFCSAIQRFQLSWKGNLGLKLQTGCLWLRLLFSVVSDGNPETAPLTAIISLGWLHRLSVCLQRSRLLMGSLVFSTYAYSAKREGNGRCPEDMSV